MKYKIVYFIVISCFLCSCNQGIESRNSVVHTSTENVESETKLKDEKYIPEIVSIIYSKYKDGINEKELPLEIGEIREVFANSYYEFYLQLGLDDKSPSIKIHLYDGKLSSYYIAWNEDFRNNDVIKNCIASAIAINENIDFESAKKYMTKLVNSYDGYSQSDVIILDKYRYIIKPSDSISQTELNMVLLETWNEEVDKSLYNELTSDFMKSPLNQGEHGYLSGKVISDRQEKYHNTLEIQNGDNKYLIYYVSEDFAQCFENGSKYIFYGDIARCEAGYDGCLRIDYYENIKK